MKKFFRLLVLFGACAAAASAQTLLHQWRFGENEDGATNGGAVTTITDHVGTLNLTASGTVTYTNSTPGSASSLAATFNTDGSFAGAVDGTLTAPSSFIIEGWFRFDGTPSASTNILFYNGNPSATGLGLYVTGNTLQILTGGQNDFTVGTVNVNQWNYVALAYDLGTTNVYLNSDTTPSYSSLGFFTNFSGNDASEKFYLGGGFVGAVDELRVSSFSGSFNTSMLSYASISAVPEPSTYAALAGLAALGVVAWRRRAVRA